MIIRPKANITKVGFDNHALPAMSRLCLIITLMIAGDVFGYDLPALNLGATSFLDGGSPMKVKRGFIFQQFVQYYRANDFKDRVGNAIRFPTPTGTASPEFAYWVSVTRVVYKTDYNLLFGGQPAFSILVPFVTFDLEPGNLIVPTDEGGGLADITVSVALQWNPIQLGDQIKLKQRLELAALLPTGEYDERIEINPGRNFLSLNPNWAGTLHLSRKWTASWRLHYLWNDKNDNPPVRTFPGAENIQAGEAVHVNFTTAYRILPRLRVGTNGYYLKQFTDTKVDGHGVPGRREQVLGLGPGAAYRLSPKTTLFLNLYFETETENRTEGTLLNLRLFHEF